MITLVDCGCQAQVHKDGSGIEIAYCKLHAAAGNLYQACKRLGDIDYVAWRTQGHVNWPLLSECLEMTQEALKLIDAES